MGEDWSRKEVELIVADYFNMLNHELSQRSFNKTIYRKSLMPLLNARSEGSIEFKHQNISAILINMGLPFIKGYKARFNYQQMLEEAVAAFLETNFKKYEPSFENFSNSAPSVINKKVDFKYIIGDQPEPHQVSEVEATYRPVKINYLEREQNNRSLGEEGEKLVIEYEKYRLISAGKESLADKIEWISKEKGDGTGYDILSKNINGSDRFVEVKTTKLTKETPIYLTRTELSFAALRSGNFFLYRVYNFDAKPQLFIKNGAYEKFCQLLPQTFKGYF